MRLSSEKPCTQSTGPHTVPSSLYQNSYMNTISPAFRLSELLMFSEKNKLKTSNYTAVLL